MLKQKLKTLMIYMVGILVLSQLTYAQLSELKLLAGDGMADDMFGYSVSNNGDYAIVGAWAKDDSGSESGSAYIFVRDGESWSQQAKLIASDGTAGDHFGGSVSISSDYAIVGADSDDDHGTESGSAYIFVRDGETWTQQVKLTASDGSGWDYFGLSVSISGDYAIISSFKDDDGGTDAGAAYIFVRDGETWTQQAKLIANDASAGDFFGISVSLNGDYAISGAYKDDDNGSDAGSVYIFVRDGENWTQQAKLIASDAASFDFFGSSVSISDNDVIVGAWGDDDGGNATGSAYIFVRNGINWTQQAKLNAADPAANDYFGTRASISNDYAIIGAYEDDDDGSGSGSAYIFVRDSVSWTEHSKLTGSDAEADDRFGYSVSISGGYVLSGAYWDDDSGTNSGSVYAYTGYLPTGVLSITQDSLDFGTASIGETGNVQLIVKNTGTADLNVTSITIIGVDSLYFRVDTTSFTLTPGDSQFVDISFTPTDTVSYSALLNIESYGGNTSVALTGLGIAVVSVDQATGLPADFALAQNYPNPFNPITQLRYDLPEQAFVTLTIYDLLGRNVATLVNQIEDVGYKAVMWDGKDDHGRSVSAGVYLYRIKAGDYIQTKKMILLK